MVTLDSARGALRGPARRGHARSGVDDPHSGRYVRAGPDRLADRTALRLADARRSRPNQFEISRCDVVQALYAHARVPHRPGAGHGGPVPGLPRRDRRAPAAPLEPRPAGEPGHRRQLVRGGRLRGVGRQAAADLRRVGARRARRLRRELSVRAGSTPPPISRARSIASWTGRWALALRPRARWPPGDRKLRSRGWPPPAQPRS